ncbi:ABC transporter permease [Streptomyces sp. VRA16 Mangrove soil]|uniref:ABC transporter permease n=1 Tax=Streptomyces sp. VRA16 Mangrove soil TaxID=2817434 RepID=UPI001A9F5B8F|nr:ABC transporter permease [Streptomyces sp. VRA16 Mangrove soil]MBO1334738.1 ABC transporter permease [Streptomyces sp. VRA16 Mangrove soil]
MFLTYLRRELRRRRKAALVVASGLALGIALVITVTSVSAGMKQAQSKVLESLYGLGTDMTVTKAAQAPSKSGGDRPNFTFDAKGDEDSSKTQSTDRVMTSGGQTLKSSLISEVAEQKGVDSATGALTLDVMKVSGRFSQGQATRNSGSGSSSQGGGMPSGGEGGVQGGGADFDVNSYSVYGIDVAHQGLGPLSTMEITKGRTFKASETNAKIAVVSKSYAKENSEAVGDTLTISKVKYEIVGIAQASSSDSTGDVYLPLKQAQTLADSKNKVSTIYVKATDSQKIDTVKATIKKNIPGTTVTTSSDLADTVSGSLSTASDLASSVGKWLSVVVLAAAVIVAALLTSSAVSRRVREFGTLKALGWKSGRVTRQVAGEAIVNGLVGGALGIALGVAAAYAVTALSPTLTASLGTAASGSGGTGGGMGGPGGGGMGGPGGGGSSAASTIDVALSAPVSLSTIALAAALAIAGGLTAGAYGGWRASRLRPADALRRVE